MCIKSLLIIHDEHNEDALVCIYRQYDGYPTSRGQEIKDILNDGKVEITNGIRGSQFKEDENQTKIKHNGMGELAAWVLMQEKLQNPEGNVYLFPCIDEPDYGQEFEYHLYKDEKGGVRMQVYGYGSEMFHGNVKNFDPVEVEKKAA